MIVVTGAAGFIGSAIVWALNKKGFHDIHAVDFLQHDNRWQNLANFKITDYEEKDAFIKRVIFDDKVLKDSVEGIIHMGACSSTTETDASFLIENNYKYTQVLAKWCVKNNNKFVYASSAATYGAGEHGFNDNHEGLEKLKPMNKYAFSKQLLDLWAQREGNLDKICGLKYFNVYGPNEEHKEDMRSVVHKAYGQIKETGKLKLFKSYKDSYADGGQLRDFIYVKDAVDMTLFAYEKGIKGIYNVGTGKARSFADLGAAVFKAMGKPVNIEYIEMPESIRDKYQYFTEAKMDKIQKAGYNAKGHTLEAGVEDYVKNYLMHEDQRLK